jgi:hypothetical protein
MKPSLKVLSEVIAQGNDLFYEQNSTLDTVIGIMDKSLRQQGMDADAISVDCIPLNKKIVFLVHDIKPHQVDIAFGNKAGEIASTSQLKLSDLTAIKTVELMQNYFNK